MATYRARPLPRDVAKCYGTNGTQKHNCARYLQIELDKKHNSDTIRVVYADALRYSADQCNFMIGEL